jgi:hypothetical protein
VFEAAAWADVGMARSSITNKELLANRLRGAGAGPLRSIPASERQLKIILVGPRAYCQG